MGCCCSCLSTCCCTEAGLRCHSVITICGVVYFGFMFALFERQKRFFEFQMGQEDNTKIACLLAAAIWLLFFLITIFQLQRLKKNKVPSRIKNKMTILDIKTMQAGRQPPEQQQHHEQQEGSDLQEHAPMIKVDDA